MPDTQTRPMSGRRPSWREQVDAGVLVCPVTKQRLRHEQGADRLVCEDGSRFYPLLGGEVPVLLRDQARVQRYLADSAMPDEYRRIGSRSQAQASPDRLFGVKAAAKRRLYENYRSQASTSALERALASLPENPLCLSVGGGPSRDQPIFVNLNLDAYLNVDVIADAHDLPYADGSVDFIFCSAVLEHLYDPGTAVHEMHRVLKPGGRVCARTPFLQPYHGYPHHYQSFTLTGHRHLFLTRGFELIESGTDVGPTYSLVHMAATYIQEFAPAPIRKPLLYLWLAAGHGLLKPLDRRLNARGNSHVLASTTFVIARKAHDARV